MCPLFPPETKSEPDDDERAVPMLRRSLTTTATTACARASLCRLSARPTLSGLVMQTQHLSRQLSTTSTVAALQAENARLHALVNKTALDNQRLLLQVVPAILRVVPDEQVAASPALLQMLRDQVIRLEKVQEVGHELERLADPEAAKYVTAATAVTTSGNADLHAQITEREDQQHTRASEETMSSIDMWSISSSLFLAAMPIMAMAMAFWAGKEYQRCIASLERLDRSLEHMIMKRRSNDAV